MVNLLDSSEQIKTIYLVRHGETIATEKGRICGRSDVSLTEKGVEQTCFVAGWFYDLPIDSLFSSPLSRTVALADGIAKSIRKPTYYKHSGLLEKDEGEWEGKTYWQVRAENEKAWELWSKDPIKYSPPKGESVEAFVARVGRALKDILHNYETGNKVILTTHSGVIKSVLIHALNIPVDNFFRIDVPLGSISRIDWSDSFASLKFWGLVPESPSFVAA